MPEPHARFPTLFPPARPARADETIGAMKVADIAFAPIIPARAAAVFIDGGNATVFQSPARIIALVKWTVVRADTRACAPTTHSYLASCTLQEDIVVRMQPLGEGHPSLDGLAGTLPVPDEGMGEHLIDLLRAEGERRLGIAVETATPPIESHVAQLIVHDGSTRIPIGLPLAKNAIGIMKTNSILTSAHRPLPVALLERAPAGIWAAELEDTWCVRLHPRASHIFLVDGACDAAAIALLASWSDDAAFPGYPYPLVLADQLARVTNNERDAWRVLLKDDLAASHIIDEGLSSDAHDMLEHILYGR